MNKHDKKLGIRSEPVKRIPTGLEDVDWLYGMTRGSDGKVVWGLPQGKISLWSGAGGVGKSRAAKTLASSIMNHKKRVVNGKTYQYKVKYIYLEEEEKPLAEVVETLREGYHVAFIDSLNTIKEYGNGSENNVRTVIAALREISTKFGTHIVLLCQQTKDGNTRGSSVLTHLPDAVFYVNSMGPGFEKYFVLRVGEKNRYGKTGANFVIDWRHETEEAVVDSNRRWTDKTEDGWCDTHPQLCGSTVIEMTVKGWMV
jgi:predicted ATP-dependent serine protease